MLTLSLALLLAAPPAEPTDTRVVLLLDDLSVVEAEPHKDGYAVRKGKVLEPIPADRVRFAGTSKLAVHQFLMAQAAAKPAGPSADLGVHPQAVPGFAGQVQAILVNRCAGCHARPDHPGGFKLARVAAGFADPDATARNLRAAGLQVNRLTPPNSPLLTYAARPHGGAPAAPLDRGQPAYAALARWVALAAAPQPGERRQPASRSRPATPPVAAPTATPPKRPAADPTDPGPFNRAVHPGR